ncbi:hypothetical protein AB3M92_08180 [Micrococcus luteus]
MDELMFLAGRESVSRAEEQEASIAAAQLMADIFCRVSLRVCPEFG